MDLNFGGVNQLFPQQIIRPLDRSCFTDQATAAGYMGAGSGATQHELFLDHQLHHIYPYPSHLSNPHDMHSPVRIEIEKERIRGEIIKSEIARMRYLMTASDLALQMGTGGFPFGQMEFCSLSGTRVEDMSLKVVSVEKTKRINGTFQSGEFNKLPLQREVAELELSCALCQIMAPNEKALVEHLQEKDILKENGLEVEVTKNSRSCGPSQMIATMCGDMSSGMEDGEKFTSETLMGKSLEKQDLPLLPVNHNSDDLRINQLIKIQKREWTCALCQLTVSSEQTLNEHLQGKKHRLKEVGVRAEETGESCNIGLSPTSATESVLVAITVDQNLEERAKFTAKSLLLEKPVLKEQYLTPLKEKLHKSDSKINHSASSKTVESSALAKIGASSEGHHGQLQGKKHELNKAALIAEGAGENLPLMTATNSVKAVDPRMEERMKRTAESVLHGKTGESSFMKHNLPPLLANVNSDDLKKNQLTFVRKVEKSCALCQCVAPNERALNEHLHGKKHRLKEASLRDMMLMTSSNSIHVKGTAGRSSRGVKFTDESFQLKKHRDEALDHQPLLDDLINNELCQKVQVNGYPETKEQCEPCNVGASNRPTKNSHKKGKEQLKWRAKTEQKYGCGSPDLEQVTEGTDSEYVDGTLDIQRSEDDGPIDSLKPEDCKFGVLSKTSNSQKKTNELLEWCVKSEGKNECHTSHLEHIAECSVEYEIKPASEYVDETLVEQRSEDDCPSDCKVGVLTKIVTNSHKKTKEWRVKSEGKHECVASHLEQITECIVEYGIKPASEYVDETLAAQRSEDHCPIDSFKPDDFKVGVLSKISHKKVKERRVKSEGKHGCECDTPHLEQITESIVEYGIKPASEYVDETLVAQRSEDDCPIDSFKPDDFKVGVLSKISHKKAKERRVKSEGKHGCDTPDQEQITESIVEYGIKPASEYVDETLVVQRSEDHCPIDSFEPGDCKFEVLSKTITNSHKKAKELLEWRVKSITECEYGINPTSKYVDETLDVQRFKDDYPIDSFGCKSLHPCTKITQVWVPKN